MSFIWGNPTEKKSLIACSLLQSHISQVCHWFHCHLHIKTLLCYILSMDLKSWLFSEELGKIKEEQA